MTEYSRSRLSCVYLSHESSDAECRLRGPQCPADTHTVSPLLSRCEPVWLSPRPAQASLLHQISLDTFTIKGSRWKAAEAALCSKILRRKFFDLHSQSFTPPSSASCLSCPFLLSHFFRLSPFLHPVGKPSQFFPLGFLFSFLHCRLFRLRVEIR